MIRRANSWDKDTVVSILSKAFDQNPSVNYVIKQDAKRRDRIKGLMSYSFDICNSFGEVLLSQDKNACALTLLPEQKKVSLKSVLWDIKLATSVVGVSRIKKILQRESKIKQNHPTTPFCYLWFIGVDPVVQRSGLGGGLLRATIDACDQKERPIYLETSVEENLSWYKHHGFEIFETLDVGYKLYLLRRLRSN